MPSTLSTLMYGYMLLAFKKTKCAHVITRATSIINIDEKFELKKHLEYPNPSKTVVT